MIRKYVNWCLLILITTLPFLTACLDMGAIAELAPTATSERQFDSPLKPITVMADDLVGSGEESQEFTAQPATSAEQPGIELIRAANLPVVIAGNSGQVMPTATPTGTIQTPTASITPSPSATSDNKVTPTVTSTVIPGGASATPTTESTITSTPTPDNTTTATSTSEVATVTPTATSTSESATVTPTATGTLIPGATATPTATQDATPSPTATDTTQHFANCKSRTGSNATVAVRGDISITGNFTFDTGDEIAVFTPDGAICAGRTDWTGENIAVTAWGDNSQTPEIDGLRSGETMKFRIWDSSASAEYLVTSTSYQSGPGLSNGVYATDSIHVMIAMTVASP